MKLIATRRDTLRLLALAALAWPARSGKAQTSELTIGIPSDPVTLDPALMASYFELSVQFSLHEPLLHLSTDLTIAPGLATATELDPLTYRFELRPDLKFHDDTPIDARAVEANFLRVLDPSFPTPRRVDLAPVQSVTVTGPLTLEIKLKTPYQPFLQVLTQRAGLMVSPTALQKLGADFGTHAVGAGPYKLVSWNKNSELVLERFDRYWRGRPAIERLVFRPIADESVRVTNLRSGTVQMIDGVPPQSVEALRQQPGMTVKELPGVGFQALSFNMTRPPFDDLRVRQAFLLATDPQAVWRTVYFKTGVPAHGPIPPTIDWAYDASFKPYETDPARGKALLDQAGIVAPIPVTITVTNDRAQIRTAEILQAQANQVGFKVELRLIDPTSLISVLRKKDFDLCMSPWSGRTDPDGNMYGWFTANGPFNFTGYRSEPTTELLEAARRESDRSQRAKLYQQAQAQIAAAAPMLFLVFPATLQASQASLDWVQFPDGAIRPQFAKFSR